MAVLDRNELFFTALKIAVAQEKNPYWIFKTNLLHIDNIATTIHSDNLIRPSIDLDSIYEYIDEALPFHDRFENYAIQYSKNDEICNVNFEEERTLTIQIGYENVTEYPTTVGYDSLPYDFEYPGIGLSGSDYESLGYNPDFGYEDIEDHPIISTQVSGWYPFKNPVNRDITQGRNRTGSIQEDPLGALYDYQPSYQQFQNVLSAYNANKSFGNPNYQDIDIKDLMDKLGVEFKIENGETIIYINGKRIDEDNLQSEEASMAVSIAGANANNSELYSFARKLIDMYKQKFNVIVSGRDLMNIYPDLDYHLFIEADLEERVKRKMKQYGESANYDEVRQNIMERDKLQEKAGYYEIYDKTIRIDVTDCSTVEEATNKVLFTIGDGLKL